MRSIVGDNTQEDLWIHENAVEERVTHIVVIGKQGCTGRYYPITKPLCPPAITPIPIRMHS